MLSDATELGSNEVFCHLIYNGDALSVLSKVKRFSMLCQTRWWPIGSRKMRLYVTGFNESLCYIKSD